MIRPTRILRGPDLVPEDDVLAIEEPLEIRLNGRPLSVTMRTPGHDAELAAGFLWSEGIIHAPAQIRAIHPCETGPNVMHVDLDHEVDMARLSRHTFTTSSCGICGKTSLDAIATSGAPEIPDVRLDRGLLGSLPARLRERQPVFASTGGLHATGLFTVYGEPLAIREDVGRHNAFDKAVGHLILTGHLPRHDVVACVSGRASFELVQKAVMAGFPAMVAVGAPSSLAVDLAEERGLTLLGFVRDGGYNVYSNPWRLSP